MPKLVRYLPVILVFLALLGLFDATYLTLEHYRGTIPPCSIHWWAGDCGLILQSSYSSIAGIPLALLGCFQYLAELILVLFAWQLGERWARAWLSGFSLVGLLASLVFVYLMLFVIHGLCWYCLGSALISSLIFLFTLQAYPQGLTELLILLGSFFYQHLLKPLLFRFDPETVHVRMVLFGEFLGQLPLIPALTRVLLRHDDPRLRQRLHRITYSLPIGLAAGFDYEGRLTQILDSLGFGFQTVGTITNRSYAGNLRPLLGRLPKSRSLMVNKGFKNPGASAIIHKLSPLSFAIPVGISVGRTNSRTGSLTQKQSIEDICAAFTKFERSPLHHHSYELNISCPNLRGNVSFYPPDKLDGLLTAVDALHLSRPIYVKMPIECTLPELDGMLKVICRHSPVGVVIGNLQKNRQDPALVQSEVREFPVGNFSGKPTFVDSNVRIAYTYAHFGKKLTIIGCGGVFSADDAYLKIQLGASLVQLITGMIYQGPTLIADINLGLSRLLARDGYTHISQAVGTKVKLSSGK